jgi:diguanylate cyclase (GGDEF)-like protein/PAS domain S-box-containing protein
LGIIDYIYKPYPPAVLLNKVSVFLILQEQKKAFEKQTLSLVHELLTSQQLQEKNNALLSAVGQGILGVDAKGFVTFVNTAAEELLGQSSEQLETLNVMDIIFFMQNSSVFMPWDNSPLLLQSLKGERWRQDKEVYWKKGELLYPAEITASPVINKGNFDGVVIAFQDISARMASEKQLQKQAYFDTLTGLANRNMLNEILGKAMSNARRYKHQLAVLFCDLDKFKQVNDTLGHNCGDELLIQVAQRLNDCTREGDTVSRLGGDEFVILLDHLNSEDDAAMVAQKVIDSIFLPFIVNGHEVKIGTSIGVAMCNDSEFGAESLIKYADTALYSAKARGRNQFQFFTASMQYSVDKKANIEQALVHAVDKQEFQLLYQPQIDLKTYKMVGVEALIRWNSGKNTIMPDTFIPIAEESGLIEIVGQWVLKTALAQNKRWNQPVVMSINLSMRQFFNPNLQRDIETAIEKYNIKPENLCLELTESMVMENSKSAIKILHALRAQGVKVSIDDFGTGYSSLSYLQNLPIDELKIDRCFITKIGESSSGEAILKSIIDLSHNLGFKTVAEGVETAEQRRHLSELGCDICQGYLFSKPVSADNLVFDFDKIKK